MTIVAGRVVLSLLVVAATFRLAEHRLSDELPRIGPAPLPPSSWQQALHSISDASSATNCPMVVSIDRRSAYSLTSVEDGVRFDIDADGDVEQVAWTEPGSDLAFLAFDRNGDGTIRAGDELIGHRTLPGLEKELEIGMVLVGKANTARKHGRLDGRHPLFRKMLLWTDTNHNGISERTELRPAEEVVSTIGLSLAGHHWKDRAGNESRRHGFVHIRTAPGLNDVMTPDEDAQRVRSMYDVCLVTR
jgi:hypothetical protein